MANSKDVVVTGGLYRHRTGVARPKDKAPPIHAIATSSEASVFLEEVLACFGNTPHSISPKWFYDRRGSELFESITQLPEYYVTRTEASILAEHQGSFARLFGRGASVVELGSGSSTKTALLLSALEPIQYFPVDISGEFLREAALQVARDFPSTAVHSVEADFTKLFTLRPKPVGFVTAFFPGSTIGNWDHCEAISILRELRFSLGGSSSLLIGVDRRKDPETLVRAYDDARGVTGEFNRNVLHRINRELGGTIVVDDFKHVANWNSARSCIEMRLEASRSTAFDIAGHHIELVAGESIHTESSYKYTRESAETLLRAGGWKPTSHWEDAEGKFSVIAARAAFGLPLLRKHV